MKYIVQYAALAMAMLCGTSFLSGLSHLLGTYNHTYQHSSSLHVSLSQTLLTGVACIAFARIYQLMVRSKSDAVSKTQTEIEVIHVGFLGAWFCFLFVVHKMNLPQRSVSSRVVAAFVLLTACSIWSGFFMRKALFKKSADALADNVGEALRRWRGAHFVSFSYGISIAIFGAVLKLIGSSWYVAGIFFGLSLGFLLLWGPRQMAANIAQPV